jgi:hypothetical protein
MGHYVLVLTMNEDSCLPAMDNITHPSGTVRYVMPIYEI